MVLCLSSIDGQLQDYTVKIVQFYPFDGKSVITLNTR